MPKPKDLVLDPDGLIFGETQYPQMQIEGRGDNHLITSENVIDYILAGKCIITLKSKNTGTRFTYKILAPRDVRPELAEIWFVNVLTGSNNNADYTYMGQIKEENGTLNFWRGKKSPIGSEAPSFIAWNFVWKFFREKKDHPQLEIWHEGQCCRCGRRLTDPDSIERGMGSDCAQMTKRRAFK
jgi:hypothetical protein